MYFLKLTHQVVLHGVIPNKLFVQITELFQISVVDDD